MMIHLIRRLFTNKKKRRFKDPEVQMAQLIVSCVGRIIMFGMELKESMYTSDNDYFWQSESKIGYSAHVGGFIFGFITMYFF